MGVMHQPIIRNPGETTADYGLSLQDVTSVSIDTSITEKPKATMVMASTTSLGLHDLVELFTIRGSAGFFRVVSSSRRYDDSISYQLIGAVDTLEDALYEQTSSEDVTKTAGQWIVDVMGRQSLWQSGQCDLTASVKIKPNYQSLWTILDTIVKENPNYYYEADYSVSPWRLNLKQLPSTVDGQLRVTRNLVGVDSQITDEDLCNRLIMTFTDASGNVSTNTYNNTTSQSAYGVRTRCTDLKAADLPAGVSMADYAQQLLTEHAQPKATLQIDGLDAGSWTGESIDNIRLGSMCSVILPNYSRAGYTSTITMRVTALSWPDVYGEPGKIKAQMGTRIEPLANSLAQAAQMARSARGGGGGKRSAKEDLDGWSKVVTKTIDAVDGTGITQMWQSGIDMTAEGGVKIFSFAQGYSSLYSNIHVQAGRIDLVVSGEGSSASIKIQAIVDGINTSAVEINADKIYLNGQTIATAIEANAASITNLMNGTTLAGSIRANNMTAGTFKLNNKVHNNSNITIDGVTYNIVTWANPYGGGHMAMIRLADGSEHACSWCGLSNGCLNIDLTTDQTLLEIAEIFSNADLTYRMEYIRDGAEPVIREGYTDLVVVNCSDRESRSALVMLWRTSEDER